MAARISIPVKRLMESTFESLGHAAVSMIDAFRVPLRVIESDDKENEVAQESLTLLTMDRTGLLESQVLLVLIGMVDILPPIRVWKD